MPSPVHTYRIRFACLALALCAVAVACSDGMTGPEPLDADDLRQVNRPSNAWSCGYMSWTPWGPTDWLIFCYYDREAGTTPTWTPPPTPTSDDLQTVDYPYCGENPYACGSPEAGASNPYTPCEGFFDNTQLAQDGVGLNPNDPASSANFDCRLVKCPPPSVYLNDGNVSKAAAYLLAKTKETGKEYGAWLYLNPDGTIRVGPIIEGIVGSVPAMGGGPPDPYVIGSIHSHPPGAQWEQPPGDQDKNFAVQYSHYVVVASAAGLYIYPDMPMPGWRVQSSNPSDPPVSCY